MKIIVILRDPVDRAVSHYFHAVRSGRERRSVAQAMRAPEADSGYMLTSEDEYPFYCGWLGGPLAKRVHTEIAAAKPINRAYVNDSRYFEQLESWLDCFGEEGVLIIRSEALFSDPNRVIDKVLRFIEVPDAPLIKRARVFNEGKRKEITAVDRRFLETALEATRGKVRDSEMSTDLSADLIKIRGRPWLASALARFYEH